MVAAAVVRPIMVRPGVFVCADVVVVARALVVHMVISLAHVLQTCDAVAVV